MKPVVIITGAANGLGREIAVALHTKYRLVLIDIDKTILHRVAYKFKAACFVCDISDYASVSQTIDLIAKEFGSIDVLINNAGIYLQGELSANKPEVIDRVIKVNTLGTINMCRAVVPHFKHQQQGTIINIISQAALYPQESRSVYHASKWAVNGFTQSLQPELAPYNIKVIGVYPGLMKTKLLERAGYKRNMETALDPADVVSSIKFLLSLPPQVTIPEIGIKHLRHY